MPKSNKPPKYSKMNKYAVVYVHGKPHYLGLYGSEESKIAYARFLAEMQSNPVAPLPCGKKKNITVRELSAAFLDHAKSNPDSAEYRHCRVIALDFLGKLYGDDFPVDDFKPRCLVLVRAEMIKSRRFCRNTVNSYVRRIVSMFTWGVTEELVNPNTTLALKAVKSLPKGYTDTFDNQEREPVPDDVIERTLPFLSPTVRTMVQIQRITGMRPSEVYQMSVGDIDRTRENGLWYFIPQTHKTEKHIGKKVIPLGKPEQKLLAPYLEGKKLAEAVFSPRTAMQEWYTERRANRKTKISPSQAARDQKRKTKPSRQNEFYDKFSYRQAIEHAIKKGNKVLPEEKQIPHWFPYQLRHTAGTEAEKIGGLDKAQALLGHRTANVTKRYAHGQLEIAESMARDRKNPFGMEGMGAES